MINEFRGKYFFLSNFYTDEKNPIIYNGISYICAEAAFQAQKDPSRSKEFSNLLPNKAKALGRRVNLRPDWEDVKDHIMEDILRIKFKPSRSNYLFKKLINTYKEKLVEGNNWNDTYWGMIKDSDGNYTIGKNKLGKILMKIRDEHIK